MFRVLDLGAHDGFVTLWLARQMRERGHEVQIRGLELHPGAVDIANQRAMDEGFDADYRQGLAEDAMMFWADDFDAVVAFEVIEHVLDVPKFLDVCEQMCHDEGRIYLSTPNGCFGSGQNPHHLRVYRDIDMFNLLRRRGTVVDLHQGADGVTVVSYKPGAHPKREAVVYAGAGWEKWHPRDIETKGLGGSETAAAMVAHELTELGFAVTLYGELEEGMWRQVELRHHSVWDPTERRDLTIISRNIAAVDANINSETLLFWMHDTDYGDAMTQERVDKVDHILVLSDWHMGHVLMTYSIDWFSGHRKLVKTTNGINPDFFHLDKMPTERPHRAIFSSSPDRGLDFLVKLWPKVREQVPDAELVYCYSAVYDKVAETNPALAAFRKKIQDATDTGEGLVNLRSLSQPDVAAAMSMCRLWLHPSYNGVHDQKFYETFCIGAVEAAAAGCHRIMSAWGALVERDHGADFTQIAKLDEDAWVGAIVKHMTDEDRIWHSFPRALDVTWAQTASDMAALAV